MRPLLTFILALTMNWCLSSNAEGILIIAHPGVATTHLSADELASIYLLKTIFWKDGERIVPVNREASSEARNLFSDVVLQHPPNALNAYWNKMHFKGKIPPLIQESDLAVLSFVQKVPGAVGYIDDSIAPQNVKVLARLP